MITCCCSQRNKKDKKNAQNFHDENPPPGVQQQDSYYNVPEPSPSPSLPQLPPRSPSSSTISVFSYDELVTATDDFSEANLLDQRDYGCVHKGILPNGKEIVVKSFTSCNRHAQREFQVEAEISSRLFHEHIHSLLGYCITELHKLLVFKYAPNRSLHFHLHEKKEPTVDWPTRLRIAIGSAKGLAYIHDECYPRIIHGNVKAANILLNHKFVAKVADFGLAKFLYDDNTTYQSARHFVGSVGYLAPEYVTEGKISCKSDVFSLGVVLLELITGHQPFDLTSDRKDGLLAWAMPLLIRFLEENDFDCLVDPRLQNNYDRGEMARMIICAASCVRHSPKGRPWLSQVVRVLEEGILDLNTVQ